MSAEMVVCNLGAKATSPTSVRIGTLPLYPSESRPPPLTLDSPPSAPSLLHPTRPSPQIELKWDPPADVIAAIKYRVKYSEQGGKNAKMIEVGGDSSCDLAGLQSAM